jgi:hypothetical protein
MHKALSWLLLGAMTVGFGSGCGSSTGAPPSCGQVQPCGGSVVGNWKMLGGCIDGAALAEDIATNCPGATLTISNLQIAGTLGFNADLTYNAGSITESFTELETLPASCLGMTCAQLDAMLQTMLDPTNGIQSASCSGDSVCTCRVNVRINAMGESGTYSTAGNVLTLTNGADGSIDTPQYCVQADLLHVVTLSTTMMTPMGMARIDSDLVAQKQ